ncbi:11114_t:CDS:2 [Funneliformis geosporum]|nr:11114_t:CDS:2 [Funneliformis geosporum]
MRSLPTDSYTYELGRVLPLMELLCQASHQESNYREAKGMSHTEPGKIEETAHEDRTKKGIPPTYDKPYTYDTRQKNKEIHGGSFSWLITRETATTNEIKCSNNKNGGSKVEVKQYDDISRGKSCSNSTRIEALQAQLGQLRRIGTVGSDEGAKWTSCRFVQPRYRIGRDGSQRSLHNVSEGSTLIETQGYCNNSYMVIDIIASESGRHQLADATNQGPCEVSSLTECMNAKSGYGTYFDEVQNFSFNHIILVGKREHGIIFLDCYGRLFELDMMSYVLWPLGNSLEEAKTKPWTGEVAWSIDDDGIIFELEYYTEAERTTHDLILQDYPKPRKLEEFYKKIPSKKKGKKKKSKKNSTIF